jgi:L-cysteine desulfidase
MNYTFTAEERKEIIALMNREIIPAIGCTEPIAVALCVAKATETLGCRPERIEARLSANVLKNAMGVGIPGTGMTGLPIAMALGALVGKSEYELEVLKDADEMQHFFRNPTENYFYEKERVQKLLKELL